MKIFLLVAAVALGGLCSGQTAVTFVRAGGSGDGGSWADATGDLAAALAGATAGDEVWVATGTYVPVACEPCSASDRERTFRLPSGVALRGGFAGTEAEPAARPSPLPPTILSGVIDARAGTQALTVLTASAPARGTIVEGFTFRGGLADGPGLGLADAGVSGAHLDITAPAPGDSLVIAVRACRFEGARSKGFGGAVYVGGGDGRHADLRFEACAFVGNRSAVGGGAVYVSASGGGTERSAFVGCGFRQNGCGGEGGGAVFYEARDGGRIDLAVTGADFVDNRGAAGGAFEFDARFGGRGAPHFTDVRFARNRASGGGGAFYLDANGAGASDPTFERCALTDNRSDESGGALYFNGFDGVTRPVIRDTRIERNATRFYGGAIYNFGREGVATPTLVNVLVARNRASSAGGVYCLGSLGGESSPVIVNSAFVSNVAEVGGALYANASDSTGTSAPVVVNTVFYGNRAPTGPTLRNILGRPTLRHCAFDAVDCEALRSGIGEQQACLEGNVFAIGEAFVDTARQDYRPRAGGPLVDAGASTALPIDLPAADAIGGRRFVRAAPDIGPLEADTVRAARATVAYVPDCEGEDASARLTDLPAYPLDVEWRRGGVGLGDSLGITVPTGADERAGRYAVVVGGWTGSDTLYFDVTTLDSVRTALSVTAPATDTVRVGETYELSAVALPSDHVVRYRWTSTAPAGSSDTLADYTLAPLDTGRLTVLVEATFEGQCLDSAVRRAQLSFDVLPTASALAGTLSDGGYRLLGHPVRDALRVGGLSAKLTTACLYDATGRPLLTQELSQSQDAIDVGALPPGPYVLELLNAEGRYATWVVKE